MTTTDTTSLTGLLAELITTDPDAPLAFDVVGDEIRTCTRARFGEQVEALRTELADAGIESGQCIAVMLPNWSDALVWQFAASSLGAAGDGRGVVEARSAAEDASSTDRAAAGAADDTTSRWTRKAATGGATATGDGRLMQGIRRERPPWMGEAREWEGRGGRRRSLPLPHPLLPQDLRHDRPRGATQRHPRELAHGRGHVLGIEDAVHRDRRVGRVEGGNDPK